MSLQLDVAIIGAGITGLTVAAGVKGGLNVAVFERHPRFGEETSSRNSEVIHSGIYYPKNSLKTQYCIEGRDQLYGLCEKAGIAFKKCGKLLVACRDSDLEYLEKRRAHCETLNVPVQNLTVDEVSAREPELRVKGALFFPLSGVVDSHSLMAFQERQARAKSVLFAYGHSVTQIKNAGENWHLEMTTPDGNLEVEARVVVNAAGLGAALLSNMALKTKRFEHRYCRGRYLNLPAKDKGRLRHLVYPIPPKDGLGNHVTLDQEGYLRLGPDVDWCSETDYGKIQSLYSCDWETLMPEFSKSVSSFWPAVEEAKLQPGQIGIRPKLFIEGEAFPDFLVEEAAKGFIHCLGIESPGLTASLPIAKKVLERMERVL